MNPLQFILAGSNIGVALLLIGLSIPLLKGSVKRNPTYGFRFPQSYASDEAWLAINRYGAQRLIACSAPLLLLGVATLFFSPGNNLWAILATAIGPLIVLVPCLQSWRFARRYRPQADAASSPSAACH